MNLYLISQSENQGYDAFDGAVVAAEDEQAARRIHPRQSWGDHYKDDEWREGAENEAWPGSTWASHPDRVTAALIGTASGGMPKGVILASFNAG